MSIRMMLVDDHGIVRDGLKLMIQQHDDMQIVCEAGNGREALEMAERSRPDVVLIDVSMPGLNGIDATSQMLKQTPGIKVLALSAYSNRRFVMDMLKAGASGYVVKDCVTEELIRAIRAVSSGERYLCSKAANVLIDDCVDNNGNGNGSEAFSKLTGKERELLQLLVEGKSAKQIAMMLHLSIKTIDGRRRTIMDKLDIDNLAGLTKLAIREGLTSADF